MDIRKVKQEWYGSKLVQREEGPASYTSSHGNSPTKLCLWRMMRDDYSSRGPSATRQAIDATIHRASKQASSQQPDDLPLPLSLPPRLSFPFQAAPPKLESVSCSCICFCFCFFLCFYQCFCIDFYFCRCFCCCRCFCQCFYFRAFTPTSAAARAYASASPPASRLRARRLDAPRRVSPRLASSTRPASILPLWALTTQRH